MNGRTSALRLRILEKKFDALLRTLRSQGTLEQSDIDVMADDIENAFEGAKPDEQVFVRRSVEKMQPTGTKHVWTAEELAADMAFEMNLIRRIDEAE